MPLNPYESPQALEEEDAAPPLSWWRLGEPWYMLAMAFAVPILFIALALAFSKLM